MHAEAIRTRLFREHEALAAFITEHVPSVREGTILAVTSKIVALAEGRVVQKRGVDKRALIARESEHFIPTQHCYLTLKDGQWIPNAGVDESNAGARYILWPKDAFTTARRLHGQLRTHYRVRRFGVLIVDSRVLPFRRGITGVTLGYYGFRGIRNYIGRRDLFGRKLRVTQTNVADSLATVAVLLMGEGSERTPLVLLTGAPVEYARRLERTALRIPLQDDMYRPLFASL